MVEKLTRARRASLVASPVVLGRADLAHVSGGADDGVLVEKTRHDAAKHAIGNIRRGPGARQGVARCT